jgi:2-polyprenyl-3-methyl-5-hydroxy-6-metoxy-1,4-benzoquinol methylase
MANRDQAPVRFCPGCGETSFRDRTVTAGLDIHTCTGCGLIVSSLERRKPKVGQYANVDLDAYMNSVGALRQHQSADVLALVRPFVPAGSRVLDIGCGFGPFLISARKAGYVVSGIEPDADACAGACALLGAGVVKHGTFGQATPEPASADLIATLDVLEHVPTTEQAGFAALVHDTLDARGHWVIKVPSTEGLYYRGSALLARVVPPVGATFQRRLWQTDYEFPHTVYFDRPSLTRWLTRQRFEVVAWRYLPEVPLRNIVDRLSHDGDISRLQAYLLAPVVLAINAVETIRGRSDALVVLARRV